MMPDDFEGVEWDQRKDLATRELRGLSFEFAARVLLGDYLEEKSGRQGVSEVRFMAIGPVEDTMAIVRKKLGELGPGWRDRSRSRPTEAQISQWKKEDGDEICEFSDGRYVRKVTVRALRERLGLTEEEFARRYRFPLRSVQEWEQGRKRPASGTMTLLLAISRKPKAVADALA